MAENLTFTNDCFMYCTGTTSSTAANTKYDILSATSSDRRIYGISIVSTDNAAQTVKLYITSATTSVPYQICTVNVPASSGNGSVAKDVFSDTMCESLFGKTREKNGRPYFTIPINYKIQMDFGSALGAGEIIYTYVFGETY
jgi:hypothetical protein